MNAFDYLVLLVTLLGIAGFGMWRTRQRRDLSAYLRGAGDARWFTIGLSVMATQASAITFLSTPGQGYESGIGFVQNYFGAPLALIVIAIFFLPMYRRLNVYTAYEFLGRRFDQKTRLLGAALFLLQRGIGAGITIYAPAIVLSTVFGWSLNLTIISSGLLVVIYTVAGGSDAVSLTQKYQIGVIFAGMITAFFVLLAKLPANLTLPDALAVAGGFHKLRAVDFSLDPDRLYTFWSGLLGGMFLALSYFGTDQSQVQRYFAGASLRESRLGLMFNAVCKIPMQFFILLLGALVFVLYQFEPPPVFFNQTTWQYHAEHGAGEKLRVLAGDFALAHEQERRQLHAWLDARHAGDRPAADTALAGALAAHARTQAARTATKAVLRAADARAPTNDSDYVFITFVLHYLPHGLIGLLVTVFFAAALNSKAAELNALGSTTTIDLYRHLLKRDATDAHYVAASRCFIVLWGLVAIAFALGVSLTENLIQWANIIGSIFYGMPLGLFLVAFFLRRIGGSAVFWGGLAAQALIFGIYFLRHVVPIFNISYLWYNVIGCAGCVLFSGILQAALRSNGEDGTLGPAARPGPLLP
ncbi:MAG: sodium:solute symporter [Opitutaceae bacterium]|nr:sodium:solute symporter [Opitutaceae bacterium]